MTTKPRANAGTSPQTEILITIGVIILALLALFLLWRTGINSRSVPSATGGVFLLSQEREAYAVWRSSNVRGRTLVHFGEHMPTRLISTGQVRELATARDKSFDQVADVETDITVGTSDPYTIRIDNLSIN